jgi:hypothetical protein
VTDEEYEERQRRLAVDIEDAYKALGLAQDRLNGLREESRMLHIQHQRQQINGM